MKTKLIDSIDSLPSSYSQPSQQANEKRISDSNGRAYICIGISEKTYKLGERLWLALRSVANMAFRGIFNEKEREKASEDWKAFWMGKRSVEVYISFANETSSSSRMMAINAISQSTVNASNLSVQPSNLLSREEDSFLLNQIASKTEEIVQRNDPSVEHPLPNKASNSSEGNAEEDFANQSINAPLFPITSAFKKNQPNELEFNLAVWEVFNQCSIIDDEREIVLSGYILADGKGDYIHMVNMAKKLHKLFPNRKIRLIVISAEAHRDKLSLPNKEICSTHLAYYGNSSIAAPRITQDGFKELIPFIKKAAVWISGPVGIEGVFDGCTAEAASKGIAFTEYDANTNLKSDDFSMKIHLGLGLKSAGIFTKKPKEYSWRDLQNELLKTLLFQSCSFSEIEIEQYLHSHAFFLYYQSNCFRIPDFLKKAILFSQTHSPGKAIDICFPAKNISREILENIIEKDFLKNQGIKSLKWIYYENDQKYERTIPIQEEGQELRVINPGLLSQKDFKVLTCLSAPLIGCTGDHSLAQALSYGKIPYYETPTHKRNLALSLQKIAQEKFGSEAALAQFLNSENQQILNSENQQEKFLIDDQLIEQAQALGTHLQQNHSFNHCIKGMINAYLCQGKYPALFEFQHEISKEYFQKKLSLDQVKERLQEKLIAMNVLLKTS